MTAKQPSLYPKEVGGKEKIKQLSRYQAAPPALGLTWLPHAIQPHHEVSLVGGVQVDIRQHSVTFEGDFIHGWPMLFLGCT